LLIAINFIKNFKFKIQIFFSDRIKYNHNYPDYYPQALSSPQESWFYSNDSLALFRSWFSAEYIFNKFPAYLLSKVKQLKLNHEHKNKILEAVRPKEIQGQTQNSKMIEAIRRDSLDLENPNFEKKLEKISFGKKKKQYRFSYFFFNKEIRS